MRVWLRISKMKGEGSMNNILIYVSKDGKSSVDVNLENDDIWMSQEVMANLYDTTKQNISYHLNNIFKEKELDKTQLSKIS